MDNSDSNDVNDFLLRIKQLGEKTDREDELRTKQLEQEIIEGRRRRQALRAERARSLSPVKVDVSVDYIAKQVSTLDVSNEHVKMSRTLERKVSVTGSVSGSKSKEQEIKETIESLHGPGGSISLFPTSTKHIEAPKVPAWKEALRKEQEKKKMEASIKAREEGEKEKEEEAKFKVEKEEIDKAKIKEEAKVKARADEERIKLEKSKAKAKEEEEIRAKELAEENAKVKAEGEARVREVKAKAEAKVKAFEDERAKRRLELLELERIREKDTQKDTQKETQKETQNPNPIEESKLHTKPSHDFLTKQSPEDDSEKLLDQQLKFQLEKELRSNDEPERYLKHQFEIERKKREDQQKKDKEERERKEIQEQAKSLPANLRNNPNVIRVLPSLPKSVPNSDEPSSPIPTPPSTSPIPKLSPADVSARTSVERIPSYLQKGRTPVINSNQSSPIPFLQTRSPSPTRTPTRGAGSFVQSALRREGTIRGAPGKPPPPFQSVHSISEKKLPPVVPKKSDAALLKLDKVEEDIGPALPRRPDAVNSSGDDGTDVGPPLPTRPSANTTNNTIQEDDILSPSNIHPLAAERGRSNYPSHDRHSSPVRPTSWLESALKKNGVGTPDTGNRTGTFRSPSPNKINTSSPFVGTSPAVSLPIPNHNRSKSSIDSWSGVKGKEEKEEKPEFIEKPKLKPVVRERPISMINSRIKSELNPSSPSSPSPSSTSPLSRSNTFVNLKPTTTPTTSTSTAPPPLAPKPTPEAVERLRSLKAPSPIRPKEQPSIEALDQLQKLKSPPSSPKKSETTAEAIERLRSLRRRSPPIPSEKPSIESIDQLRRLRSSSPTKRVIKDDGKDTLEQAKANLRRSNTVQTNENKESLSIPSSPSSLSRSTGNRNIPLGVVKEAAVVSLPPPPIASPNSFRDDLASALMRGPQAQQPIIKKASTLDNSELPNSKKLTHMTKKRTKGPKRRLPTNVNEKENKENKTELFVRKQRNAMSNIGNTFQSSSSSTFPPLSSASPPSPSTPKPLPPAIRKSSRAVSGAKPSPPKPRKASSSIEV